MKIALKSIVFLQTGVFAAKVAKGEVVYLLVKHFNEFGQLSSALHPDLKLEYSLKKHLLQRGDILFAAKGSKNFAALYETNQSAVASTTFFVLKIQSNFRDKILPEYLVWFINQPFSLKTLKGKAIGTSIVSISKSVLEELEVSIPHVQTQKAILKISQLHNTEKNLKQQIETLREKQIQQQIIYAIK